MAETFEFTVDTEFHFAEAFGKRFSMPVTDHRVSLPESLGTGYIQELTLREGFGLCLHHYTLAEEFSLRRLESGTPTAFLTLKFDCRKISGDDERETHLFAKGCEADLGTGNFFTEIFFPARQRIDFLVITIARELLVELLQLSEEESALRNRLLLNPSFVLNARMSEAMEKTLIKFSEIPLGEPFTLLRYQAMSYELIYLLFHKLTERNIETVTGVNRADADKLYEVKDIILKDLSVAPQLSDLSKHIAMSPTKMKTLFRQIFGDTIYNYFQTARMNEAAKLLKDYSVTETGYRLGFTNMSHFSRVFEKYFKVKPKKFKSSKS